MKIFYSLIFIVLSLSATASAPTLPASNLNFPAVDGGYFNLAWTPGNGSRRLIICKAGSPVTFTPQNGVDYGENTTFGSGQQVAPGEYVIYDNAFTSFFLTGLIPSTQYFFAVFEYNGTGAAIEYLVSPFLSGSASTSSIPTVQVSNASFSNITTNSITVSWANGNGQRRLIVVREGSPVNTDPVSGQQYAVNSSFGNGAMIGTGNYSVYNSSGSSTSVTNLLPGKEYFFSFYEFNGNGQPQYKTPACTTSVSTRSVPTIPAGNPVVTKTDGKELSLSWTNGNGQHRIIIAKKGSDVTSIPVNGVDYNANSFFGSGQQLNPGEFVVYDDNFNAAIISGLDPATVYFFKIFEYDGTGGNTAYLTSSFAGITATTATTPTIQASMISAINITANSMTLQMTAGNGRARMIIGRKGSPVNITPTDFNTYIANGDFGAGQDLGIGNFVVGNTIDPFLGVHDLESNNIYFFSIFEFNGFDQPLYLAPAATFNASTIGALPVKLTKWEATPENSKVKLQWTTSSEQNSSHFIIERSQDGIIFMAVTTVAAAGNSQSAINYTAYDISPLQGKSYYRLKTVDIDGNTEYSTTRIVLISVVTSMKIIGNPVHDNIGLVISGINNNNSYDWEIVNITGQIVKKGKSPTGRSEINVSNLNAGSYWLVIDFTEKTKPLLFIKQ